MLTERVEGLRLARRMPFVTFEGVEGSGKSTQMRKTAARLEELGITVVQTREPGGTVIGEKIREIVLDPGNDHLDPVTELLLYEADRRQHVAEVLRPAIARGGFLLCDRYSDATEAYQRAGRGLDPEAVARVDELARGGVVPDYTLVYDVDPAAGLTRAWERDGERRGRFEGIDLTFHERVRQAYREIASREPQRVVLVSAGGSADDVFRETWRLLSARFGLP